MGLSHFRPTTPGTQTSLRCRSIQTRIISSPLSELALRYILTLEQDSTTGVRLVFHTRQWTPRPSQRFQSRLSPIRLSLTLARCLFRQMRSSRATQIQMTATRHVLVLDRNGCWLYELYRGFKGRRAWQADSAAIWDMTINEQRPYTWTSADAAGLPIF